MEGKEEISSTADSPSSGIRPFHEKSACSPVDSILEKVSVLTGLGLTTSIKMVSCALNPPPSAETVTFAWPDLAASVLSENTIRLSPGSWNLSRLSACPSSFTGPSVSTFTRTSFTPGSIANTLTGSLTLSSTASLLGSVDNSINGERTMTDFSALPYAPA